VLSNCGVLTEGYDDSELSCVVMARPTKSALLFQQMIGRGTRLEEGVENRLTHPAPLRKQNCLILDVIDTSKRHSLATVPSLFGMPEVDLQGKSVTSSLRELEEVQRQYPQIDLSGLKDIDDLAKYIESVSLWEVKISAEVVEHSKLSWFHTMDGYVLSLPNREQATIKQNILGKFDVVMMIGGQSHSGTVDSLAIAFQRADATLRKHGGNIVNVVSQTQRWHKDPATPKQLDTLRKIYKGRAIPVGLSKGAACKLISQFFATKKPGPERPAWLQAKIHGKHAA
jgi:hypothetical protein